MSSRLLGLFTDRDYDSCIGNEVALEAVAASSHPIDLNKGIPLID